MDDRIFNICLGQNFIFEKFENAKKFSYQIRDFLHFFFIYYKESMFTIEIEDGREAP